MSEFINENDGFYDGEDEKAILASIASSEPHVGCTVRFAADSFFAKRGGQLLATVTGVVEPSDGDRGQINVKCLPGTDCYLSPGESEVFPLLGWEKTLEIVQPAKESE